MRRTIGILLAALAVASALRAQVPQMIAYQGRVTSGGLDFTGTGQFKFALVNGAYGGNPGETFALWTHDGTGSKLDPNVVPAGSVAVVCDRGRYDVLLGNAGAGMVPIPVSVFTWGDVRLRVWFNDGTHGFQQLSPDQRIVSVGYAMIAQQASSVPDGTITAAKIAPAAVGFSQLAKPVQSGSVSSIPITWDTATFSVSFPRTFAAVPVVTLGVQSTDVELALATTPVVTGATGARFSAHVKVTDVREAVASTLDSTREGFTAATLNGTPYYFYFNGASLMIGRYDAASGALFLPDPVGAPGNVQVLASSLALVNGNPAFAAVIWDGLTTTRLEFKRATSANGTSADWPAASVTLAKGILNPQLLSVNGAPAIFYEDGISVRMIRANDANGTTWGAPVTVATDLVSGSNSKGFGDTAFYAKVVLGQPAVAYHSKSGLRYVRATNANGTTWGASVLLDAASAGTVCGVSLESTSNLPSIAYLDSKNAALKFIRSSELIGGSWKTPVTVASGVTGERVTLLPLGGVPAISTAKTLGSNRGIHLVRAKDALGDTWSAYVAVSDPRERYRNLYPDIVLVAGRTGYFGNRSVFGGGEDFGLLYSPISAPTITWLAQTP